MKTKTKIELIALALILFSLYFYSQTKLKENFQVILVQSIPMTVDVADNSIKIKKGLMFKEKIDGDGMIFVFEESDYHSFWMKNMNFPIDIAFVDEQLKIVEIKEMHPGEVIHTPNVPIKYAIEAEIGWFQKRNISVGSEVTLPSNLHP